MKHLIYTEKSNISFEKYEPNNDSCCSINCCSRFNNNGICCTRDSTTGFRMGTPRCTSQQLSIVSGPVSGPVSGLRWMWRLWRLWLWLRWMWRLWRLWRLAALAAVAAVASASVDVEASAGWDD